VGTLRGQAFAIERFDRLSDGNLIHIEDFAQVFDVYPEDKYGKASMRNIASVLASETSRSDIEEFIRRLTFNTLIGNGDMHLKNWSLMYSDRRTPALAPAYDFVSTIPYIPGDEAALKFSRTKRFDEFSEDELSHLSAKAGLPEMQVLDTAKETVELFHQHWKVEKQNLPLTKEIIRAIDTHSATIPLS
jgi:serine/threonine-protein kinase HipA